MTAALFSVVTFLFIFGWKITAIADLILIISAALCLWVLVIGRAPLVGTDRRIVIVLLALTFYCAIITIVFGAVDAQMFLRSLRSLVNYLGAAALVYAYYIKFGERAVRLITLHVFGALVAHAVLIACMFFSADLRLGVYGIARTLDNVNQNAPMALGLRIPGLTYGLATTSVLQLMGFFLLPAIFAYWGDTRPRVLLIAASIVPLALSLLLTGRTGIALAAVMLPATWVLHRRTSLRAQRPQRRVSTLVVIVLAIAGFVYFVAKSAEQLAYNLKTAQEVAELFVEGRSETTDSLREMYFLPSDAATLMWGSSNLGRSELGNIASDVGFVLFVYASGIVGVALTLMPYLLALAVAVRCYTRRIVTPLALAMGMCFLAGILLHFKEVSLLTRNHWSVLALLLACCAVEWRKHLRESEHAWPAAVAVRSS